MKHPALRNSDVSTLNTPTLHAPSIHARKRMTRTGKIARLSSDLREQVNSRLSKGEEGKPLLKWLNSLPEVQDLLKAEFNGQTKMKKCFSQFPLGSSATCNVQPATYNYHSGSGPTSGHYRLDLGIAPEEI